MALIEVQHLVKEYEDDDVATRALRGISFAVEKSEFVAITGPSGSGKSTLLHILGLLDRPTSGTYRFEGKSFDDYTDEEIAHVRNQKMGFVFQAFNLLPRRDVLENVMLPLVYSDVPERQWEHRAREAIHAVGLSHRLDHTPAQLSGGERQRVAIARALVNHPEIIFADEPTGNLDTAAGRTVMEILQDLNEKQGHTVILVTHETYTAEHAERIIHVLDGTIDSDRRVGARRLARDDFKK